MPSTVAAPSRPVTEDEADAFHRDGAVLLKDVLSQKWVDILEVGLEEARAAPDDLTIGGDDFPLRIDEFPAARSKALRGFIDESPIAAIAGQAMRCSVRFYMDQMFCKPKGEHMHTPWHQDTTYYNIEGHDLVRAWVSPDVVPRGASLEVVRGSHRWNVDYHPMGGRDPEVDPEAKALLEQMRAGNWPDRKADFKRFDAIGDPSLPVVPPIEDMRDSFDILGWDYQPGDVILFHGNILHGAAGGLVLETERRAHASLWAGPHVKYVRRVSQQIADPAALLAQHPQIGQPLDDFPDVFPIRWAPEE